LRLGGVPSGIGACYNGDEAMPVKRVKGTYNGSAVVLREAVDIPPNTEVEVLIPERGEASLAAVLAQLDETDVGELLSVEEVAEIVHQVRSTRR